MAGGLARAAVFGISDGLTTNISLILGVAGSGVAPSFVRLAGVAGLIAGAISMASGEFVSVSAQNELVRREIEVERREMARNPEAETSELARIFEAKGVEASLALSVARNIMQDPERALAVHAKEELGVDPDSLASPWMTALWSFVAFAVGALAPLIPWFIGSGTPAKLTSLGIGVGASLAVGALVGRFAERNRLRSALRQAGILVVACAATYLIGRALHSSVS